MLELRLELLLLLLEKVDAAHVDAHHVRRHHVGQHVGETERCHLVVVATCRLAELLQALQLRLSLGEIRGERVVGLNAANTTI